MRSLPCIRFKKLFSFAHPSLRSGMLVTDWDCLAPRAVAPSILLRGKKLPVKCSIEHARDASLPYGVAIQIGHDDCISSEAQIIWVSPKVARTRQPVILSGWYVQARPGDYFKVLITNVHVDNPDIHSRPVLIEVDGTNPLGAERALVCGAGKEVVLRGFANGLDFEDGAVNGRCRVRKFRFKPADVANQDFSDEKGVGCIVIRVLNGWSNSARLGPELTDNLTGDLQSVDEKTSQKRGTTLRVDRHGEVIHEKVRRAKHEFKYNQTEEPIVIYIREKWWLESRKIIDKKGNVWSPTISKTPIDLTV